MAFSEKLFGNNRENIPNWAFNLMTFIMKVMGVLGYHEKNFDKLEIKSGQTVVDYGCGPAMYTRLISKTIGENGKLIATDIHPLALKKVNKKIKKHKLNNVETILSKGYSCPVNDNIADVILALDMFHMIQDTNTLLKEFLRIVKPDGIIIIEDGHQSREQTKEKILQSGCFKIKSEKKEHICCYPSKKHNI